MTYLILILMLVGCGAQSGVESHEAPGQGNEISPSPSPSPSSSCMVVKKIHCDTEVSGKQRCKVKEIKQVECGDEE